MKKNNRIILAIIFIWNITFSQVYNISKYNQDNGIASNYVYDITQTSNGYLFLATSEGLIKYNGKTFITYSENSKNENSIILCLSTYKTNDLLIGTNNGKIGSLRENELTFDSLQKNSSSPVTALLKIDSLLLIGTRLGKIGVKENKKLTFIAIENTSFIYAFIKFKNRIYVATDYGLYDITDINKPRLLSETAGKSVTSVAITLDDKLIAGTEDGELFLFVENKSNANRKLKLVKFINIGNDVIIKSLVIGRDNKLIIGTWGKGVYSCTFDQVNYNIKLLEIISEANGLENLFINKVFIDYNNNLWIGTQGGCIYKISDDDFRLVNKNTGLKSNRVNTVFGFKGRIFVGSDNGIQALNNNRIDSVHSENLTKLFKEKFITSINSLNDYLLIGTDNEGIFRYDFAKNTCIDFFKEIGLKDPPKTINNITNLKDSIVYIGTTDGLVLYNTKLKKTYRLGTVDGLPHNNITYSFIDNKGRIWLAAPKSPPIMVYNDSITLFKDIPGFKSYSVKSFCEDKNGNIYIGTYGDGIFKYYNRQFTTVNQNNGLGSNYVQGLCYNKKKESLICTHQNGMSVIDLITNKVKIYNQKQIAAYDNKENAIILYNNIAYLGTEQGVGIFFNNKKYIRSLPPINNFLSIKINDVSYPINDSVIELPFDSYNINFEIIGVELSNPLGVTYQFKLEGLENNFRNSSENNINYPEVKNGNYKFIFTSTSANGFLNPYYLTYQIKIDDPFYKKWWFILIIVIFLIAFVFAMINWRTRKLKFDNLLLEKKIAEKTTNINEMNLILLEKNEGITSSIDYAKRIQSLLLPRKKEIIENLNCFIFYLPRDIVSGDFYWYYKTEHYIYLAAVDCTGHGVPGAFMSLLGTSYLEQIMNDKKELLPSEILQSLDEKVINSLRQSESKSNVSDGMDIALCRIDIKNKEIIFSGAVRPIYCMLDNNFFEFKTSSNSIGGYNDGENKNFADKIIKYNDGDVFYIFSDGYGDQFGGDNNKRFSTRRIKALLQNNYSESIETQLLIVESEFSLWKKDKFQIDDILFIGFKL